MNEVKFVNKTIMYVYYNMEIHKPFDLGFSNEERNIIENIKIDKNLQFLNYYDEDKFMDKVKIYVNDIGDNKSINNDLTNIINKIVKKVLSDTTQESGIIWIRTKVDNTRSHFRWHRDGQYFDPLNNEPVVKFVVTLKGNSTPIIVDPNAIERFDDVDKKYMEVFEFIRSKINKMSFDLQICLSKEFEPEYAKAIGNNYVSALTGQGVYFINTLNNSTKNGTIHSEPIIEKDRLFIAILPYTKEKCKEWIEKQQK